MSTLIGWPAIAGCVWQRRQEHEIGIVEDVCGSVVTLVSAVELVAPQSANSSVRGGAASGATRMPCVARGCVVPARSRCMQQSVTAT